MRLSTTPGTPSCSRPLYSPSVFSRITTMSTSLCLGGGEGGVRERRKRKEKRGKERREEKGERRRERGEGRERERREREKGERRRERGEGGVKSILEL